MGSECSSLDLWLSFLLDDPPTPPSPAAGSAALPTMPPRSTTSPGVGSVGGGGGEGLEGGVKDEEELSLPTDPFKHKVNL